MLSFDEQLYKENANLTINSRQDVEAIADKISAEGYENIFFISVGGSLSIMLPIVEMIKQLSDVPVYAEHAAEILYTGHKQLSKKSIIIMASKSGNTEDSVKAAEWFNREGYRIVSMIGQLDSPMERLSKWVIHNQATRGIEFQYILLYFLVFRLLANRREFQDYETFANQLEDLPANLLKAKQKFEPRAAEIAKKYADEPYSLWVGGGEMWGEVYLFTMCVLEEMLWVRTKAISSSEFFHGTLELVEDDVPVFLIKGEGSRRAMDDRVERFCEQYTNKFEVIDTKEFDLDRIDDKFRWIMAPTISSTILVDRLGRHYEKETGHTFGDVRYYRQIQY